MVDGIPVLLAKPQTYIDLSDESDGALAAYYKLPLHRVVVAYDDTDVPCGVLRLQPKGGYGRHNGLRPVASSRPRDLTVYEGELRMNVSSSYGSCDVGPSHADCRSQLQKPFIPQHQAAGPRILPTFLVNGYIVKEARRLHQIELRDLEHLKFLGLLLKDFMIISGI